jgi:uncharacterized membrane protein YjdF
MTSIAQIDEPVLRSGGRRGDRALIAVGVVACIVFAIVSATAKDPRYHFNLVALGPLMWLPYFFRRRLYLHPVHYALFAVAILLHDLGAYGFYKASPLPFSYDILVHYYFAVPVTLILYRALRGNFSEIKPVWIGVTSLLFMMGFGALHEIMEFCSYLLLGEEKGMLKPSSSYFFDTQRDLTNNLFGTLTALTLVVVYHFAIGRYKSGPHNMEA